MYSITGSVGMRRRWTRLGIASLSCVLLLLALAGILDHSAAWDEEQNLFFYEPWLDPALVYSPTEVSSVHFDLVGALALAAGFSEADAAAIQLYSQLTDSGILTGSSIYRTADAPVSWPSPPDPAETPPSPFCPDPAATAATLSMGMTDTVECPGCFSSRWGPYNIFFHFPRDRVNELQALERWAFGDPADPLIGVATFGFSSTARFDWQGLVNIYEITPCFITTTHAVDTGGIAAGSLEALGIYLHSLGDHWSHGDCIAATEAAGLPFAAHVQAGANDPLAPCRWLMHEGEFGHPQLFPSSHRTFTGTLALYDALVAYSLQSERPLYWPIPIDGEGQYLYNALYQFVHSTAASNPTPRRQQAEALRGWALQTRVADPAYQRWRLWLPLLAQADPGMG
ncbi:MAG: hypothetical protein HUU23_18270 [Caldilineales bacterium]|nr:hypothetical protein [Caldilineales bacterium]